jgi:hypothetical protein
VSNVTAQSSVASGSPERHDRSMDRLRRLVLLGSLLFTPLACGMFGEPKPDIVDAQRHTGAGLTFQYPGNWEIEVEQQPINDITVTMITATSKRGNAVAIVQQFQPLPVVDRDQIVVDFFAGIREAMPGVATIARLDGGVAPTIHRELLGAEREGRKLRYSIEVLGESVPHTVDMIFAELEDRLIIVYSQIPDSDREVAMPGFDLVMDSLALE